ncbi:MAG TPA: hypothetical protein DCY48_00120 [Candidatus Magasanikbacteria bacterium]|nr:MAG: hypothetical protein A3I74_04855 [Candidatus Magasanikbacteria bacterium RIFCSPLOWO2_02_FULL_47_16]OGH79742.1 MAG: hypothetical protein A3C10_04005 [Candidatus Magasanikbacteria bacterium RIFCSPHIGHO2_02_FULL_48_18]HAZ28172.1 hypothetical protein [Candidatus Magasanikbacteria bacterium]
MEVFTTFVLSIFGGLYARLRKFFGPIAEVILPYTISIPFYGEVMFVTANRVTIFRTFMAIPVAVLLKIGLTATAFWLYVVAGVLDFVDGLVAMVHKKNGHPHDGVLGAFLDAFCDKAFWVVVTLGALATADFMNAVWYIHLPTFAAIAILLVVEVWLAVVRVDDFYATRHGVDDRALKARMSGKLKFTLELIGTGGLVLANDNLDTWPVYAGTAAYILAIPFAVLSLKQKLAARGPT